MLHLFNGSCMLMRISNLSHNINDGDLRKIFAAYGTVNSAEVARNKFNGRSNGYAIVEMPVEGEARQAIISLDKTTVDGKLISISDAEQL